MPFWLMACSGVSGADELSDPEELLVEHKTLLTSVAETREALKQE